MNIISKSSIFLIFSFVSISLIRLNDSKGATVDIFLKSMKLNTNKDMAKVKYCEFKTSRKVKTGLLTCEVYLLKQLDEAFIQITLYYKYGTIYRQYLMNYPRIEVCEFMKKKRSVKYSNPLVDLVRIGISKCCPLFDHECPFLPGFYNGTNIDINGTVAPLLPPIVPAGQFKIVIRMYLEKNVTVGDAEFVTVVKPNHANRAGEFSMLGMG